MAFITQANLRRACGHLITLALLGASNYAHARLDYHGGFCKKRGANYTAVWMGKNSFRWRQTIAFGTLSLTVDELNKLPDGAVIQTYSNSFAGPTPKEPAAGSSDWVVTGCPAQIPLGGVSQGRRADGSSMSWGHLGAGNGPGGTEAAPVWKTDIPGIAIRMRISLNAINPLSSGSTINANGNRKMDFRYYFKDRYSAKFEIIKSGRVSPGLQWIPPDQTSFWIGFTIDSIWTALVMLSGNIQVQGSTCKLADTSVVMGKRKTGEFTGVGSSTAPVSFALNFNGCSSVQKIAWKMDPVAGTVNANDGIFQLNTSSTATGIALQLKDGQGKAVALGRDQILNTGGAASPSIPLKISYIQTGKSVLPGSADGKLMVTVVYN